MSKTSIALILLLLLFIACFFLITFFSSLVTFPQLTRPDPPIATNETTVSETTIAFAETQQRVQPAQQNSVGLLLAAKQPLAVAQVEMSYDPTRITILDIIPGNYFLNPIELIETINPDNGRISYAVTCSAPTGQVCANAKTTDLATIRYSARQGTQLTLMPKTLVQIGETNYPVKRGDAVTIQMIGAAPVAGSPSATIAAPKPTN